uniref:Uncharacterized protein n=1 Tax=Streptomyces sp. NBC_00093 TaxID=2975649 RepID=A0AAU2AHJ9_9ACTN
MATEAPDTTITYDTGSADVATGTSNGQNITHTYVVVLGRAISVIWPIAGSA